MTTLELIASIIVFSGILLVGLYAALGDREEQSA